MNNRHKLTIEEQVDYMAGDRGILFNIISREEAIDFLRESNYYFKLKAYEKNYKTNSDNKYVGLEFAYLVELSKLDAYLRKEIMSMSLDIEHYLKVKLIADISDCDGQREDGYNIVQWYLDNDLYRRDDIRKKGMASTCVNLVEKYHPEYAIWQFVELLPFKDFIEVYEYFYRRNKDDLTGYTPFTDPYSGLLHPVRYLRNAAAHNNCLLNHLGQPIASNDKKKNHRLNTALGQIYPNGEWRTYTQNYIIKCFMALLIVYNKIAPISARENGMQHLTKLIVTRFTRHKEYFVTNKTLTSSYRFVKTALDYFGAM